MARKALTPRQHEFLDAIRADIAKGCTSTIRDLSTRLGASPTAAFDNVGALIRKGYLVRDERRVLCIPGARAPAKPTPSDGLTVLTIISRRRGGGLYDTPEFHTVTEAG